MPMSKYIDSVTLESFPESRSVRRRTVLNILLSAPLFFSSSNFVVGQTTDLAEFDAELAYPSTANPFEITGSQPPSAEERAAANAIINTAPSGPHPFDVAKYFLTDAVSPEYRTQWPSDDAWNPVIFKFFSATGRNVSNDMVPWCAAFVNWCIVRSGRIGSGSALATSFADASKFAFTAQPRPGDLVVFRCYRKSTTLQRRRATSASSWEPQPTAKSGFSAGTSPAAKGTLK
jgi:hypothetical protein